MEVEFLDQALEDIDYWKKSGYKVVQSKIANLLVSICKTPYAGIGKPEQLKHDLTGYWSRRITDEHRLVYRIQENLIIVISMRFHYR